MSRVKSAIATLFAIVTIGSYCAVPAAAQSPATTTITDTVYGSNGAAATGRLVITWPSFRSIEGRPVVGGTRNVTISNGALSVALVPNVGATPSTISYKVRFYDSNVNYTEEIWFVPSSPTPVTLNQVRYLGSTTVSGISGTLPVANGGTGLTTLAPHQLYVGNGTGTPQAIGTGYSGQVLVSNGASDDPSFQNIPQAPAKGLPVAAGLPLPICNPVRRTNCQQKLF